MKVSSRSPKFHAATAPRGVRRLAVPLALALAVCWAATSAARAQDAAPGMPALIAMTLQTDRADYYPGEPVVITVRLTNWLSPILVIQGSFGLRSLATDLRVFRNGEMSETYRGALRESPVPPDRITTRYAKTFEFRIVACCDSVRKSGMVLDAPGEYTFGLRQEFQIADWARDAPAQHGVKIEGQAPVFAVEEPDGDTAAALKLLRTNRHTFEDMERAVASPATIGIFRQIVADHPKTRYAPYCLYALARQCLALSPHRPEEMNDAARLLRQLVAEYPEFPLRVEAQATLADTLVDQGRPDAAKKIVESLIAESPDNLTRIRTHASASLYLGPTPSPHERTNLRCWYLFETTTLVDAFEQRNPTSQDNSKAAEAAKKQQPASEEKP